MSVKRAATQALSTDTSYDVIIEPARGWLNFNLKELWQSRYLVMLLVRRDIIALYIQTILGPLWFIISPLTSVGTFIVVFGRIVDIPTNALPHGLFYLSGLVIWNYFTSCVTKTSDFLVGNSHLMGKVYFPRLVIPLSTVIANLLPFAIQFLLLVAVSIYYYLHGVKLALTAAIFWIPVIVGLAGTLGFTFGVLIASLTTKFRDIGHAIGLIMTTLMYASPIIYPISQIPAQWKTLYLVNPIAPLVELFRHSLFGYGDIHIQDGLQVFVTAAIALFLVLIVYSKIEKNFIDTV